MLKAKKIPKLKKKSEKLTNFDRISRNSDREKRQNIILNKEVNNILKSNEIKSISKLIDYKLKLMDFSKIGVTKSVFKNNINNTLIYSYKELLKNKKINSLNNFSYKDINKLIDFTIERKKWYYEKK